jgi:hypothetical protein
VWSIIDHDMRRRTEVCANLFIFTTLAQVLLVFFSLETVLERVIVVAPRRALSALLSSRAHCHLKREAPEALAASKTKPPQQHTRPSLACLLHVSIGKKAPHTNKKSAKFSRPYSLGEQCHPSRTSFTPRPTTPKISFLQN